MYQKNAIAHSPARRSSGDQASEGGREALMPLLSKKPAVPVRWTPAAHGKTQDYSKQCAFQVGYIQSGKLAGPGRRACARLWQVGTGLRGDEGGATATTWHDTTERTAPHARAIYEQLDVLYA
eukprot:148320-Pleurochrysis_carterae.AAC.3